MHIKKILTIFALILCAQLFTTGSVLAAGISIDAGLTPAQNRWIFRSQVRFMQRDNDPTSAMKEMKSYMFPFVAVYGLRSDLSFMLRQTVRSNEMEMIGQTTKNSGFTDLFILGKYRLYRKNTKSYTFGIAPTLGLEIPTGNKKFTSNSWNLHVGSFVSGRFRTWGMDFNMKYVWMGMAKTDNSDIDPGNELSIKSAFAYQFSIGSSAEMTLSPVIELSYGKFSADSKSGDIIANTGESVFWISPGIKFTRSSLIFESLIQFPVWQDQNGLQTERGTSFIFGIRIMN